MRSYVLSSRHASLLATTALVAMTAFASGAASAQDATWNLNGTGNYITPGNWTPATVPSGTASFGVSNQAAVNILTNSAVGGWTFDTGASAYTFNIALNFTFNGAGIVIDGGSATLTNPLGTLQFLNGSTAGAATINNSSILTFFGTSTAGNAVITNSVTGSMNFNNSSTAGNASITNNFSLHFNDFSTAGNAVITNANTATLLFNDASTAGNATITNNSNVIFNNTSTAGSAAITNNDSDTISFNDTSTAGGATITNKGDLNFNSTSTAGSATITNATFGVINFNSSSTAGHATITNNNNIFFESTSTAGNATVINSHNVFFSGNSTAGNATITNKIGGLLSFNDNSTGGNAAITNNSGAEVDFSGSRGPAGDNRLSAGSIAGAGSFVLGANELTVGGNNMSTEVSGVVSGILGSLVKVGTGTLTLSGTNAYIGPTTVNAGALAVNGSIASSRLTTVNGSAALLGSGIVGSTVINTGGFLIPGPIGPPASMTITGSLAFQSGAFYVVQVNPTTASTTNVSGTASLAGTAAAIFAPGSFLARSYTILTASGGRSGIFDALATSGLPANFQASLSYPGNTAVLNLTAQLVPEPGPPTTPTSPTPIPPTPTTPPISSTPSTPSAPPLIFTDNQFNVGHAIDNFFNNGGALPPAFLPLFGLTGSNLTNALTQLSGEAATDGQQGAFQLMTQFLGLMLDPTVDGRNGGGTATGFASEQGASFPSDIALGYASVLKAAPKPTADLDQRWSAWGSGFGGSNHTSGDAVTGSHDSTARVYGFAGGMDYHFTTDTVAGFALAGAGTNWALADGLGGGRSEAFQVGVYGKTSAGPAYVDAALAFANHWMSTDRYAFAGDHLTASFNAQSFGGRIETGYRYGLASIGVTPYAAMQAQTFHTPAYNETDVTAGGFGLGYFSRSASDTRSELGARFDNLQIVNGMPLLLRARAAWAHDWVTDPSLFATFQTLPGASFIVNGAGTAKNSALTSAGAELRVTPQLSLAAKFDGEFAAHSQTYAGTGTIRYVW